MEATDIPVYHVSAENIPVLGPFEMVEGSGGKVVLSNTSSATISIHSLYYQPLSSTRTISCGMISDADN